MWQTGAGKNELLSTGSVDRIGLDANSQFEIKTGLKTTREDIVSRDHKTALRYVLEYLRDGGDAILKDISHIRAVGHRVVHGGAKLSASTLINGDILDVIRECAVLAPLHNPPNIAGIEAAMDVMPEAKQIAVFDTAFYTTMPPVSYIYALPYSWFTRYGIRRYGFHGISHLYLSRRTAAILAVKPKNLNVITLHIGNGASFTACKDGQAVDTSMGFTPLEGAVMGTRCGDIDPAIPLWVMEKEGLSPAKMQEILNKESGLLGITGKYVDRREILQAAKNGDEMAQLAFDIECQRIKKYIGAYTAELGRVDALVFSGGVGENAPDYRSKVIENLGCLGLSISEERNRQARNDNDEIHISDDSSKVKILVIPTREDLVILEDVLGVLGGSIKHYSQFHYSFENPATGLTI